MALTNIGKVLGLLAVLGAGYFVLFIMPSLFVAEETGEAGEARVKIIAFVKTMDAESNELIRMLEELSEDSDVKNFFVYDVIVVDVETEKADRFGVREEEAPFFVIGTEKINFPKEKEWIKNRVLETAKAMGIS